MFLLPLVVPLGAADKSLDPSSLLTLFRNLFSVFLGSLTHNFNSKTVNSSSEPWRLILTRLTQIMMINGLTKFRWNFIRHFLMLYIIGSLWYIPALSRYGNVPFCSGIFTADVVRLTSVSQHIPSRPSKFKMNLKDNFQSPTSYILSSSSLYIIISSALSLQGTSVAIVFLAPPFCSQFPNDFTWYFIDAKFRNGRGKYWKQSVTQNLQENWRACIFVSQKISLLWWFGILPMYSLWDLVSYC